MQAAFNGSMQEQIESTIKMMIAAGILKEEGSDLVLVHPEWTKEEIEKAIAEYKARLN
jgi:hypothetical protein